MRDEPRDEALPRHAAAEVAVEPEAAVPRAEDLARADRVRLRRHPRPVAAERVERVLHDRHRMQLDEPRARLLVRLEVAVELLAQVRLPERDVPAPADAAVADVGAAELLDALAVVDDRLRRREVDLARRAAAARGRSARRTARASHAGTSPARNRRGDAVLARVLVHVEGVDVREREPLLVDRPRGELVLRHRPDREDRDERRPLVRARRILPTRSSANAS